MNEGGRFMVAIGVLFFGALVIITALRGTYSQAWAVITNNTASASGPTPSTPVRPTVPGFNPNGIPLPPGVPDNPILQS